MGRALPKKRIGPYSAGRPDHPVSRSCVLCCGLQRQGGTNTLITHRQPCKLKRTASPALVQVTIQDRCQTSLSDKQGYSCQHTSQHRSAETERCQRTLIVGTVSRESRHASKLRRSSTSSPSASCAAFRRSCLFLDTTCTKTTCVQQATLQPRPASAPPPHMLARASCEQLGTTCRSHSTKNMDEPEFGMWSSASALSIQGTSARCPVSAPLSGRPH